MKQMYTHSIKTFQLLSWMEVSTKCSTYFSGLEKYYFLVQENMIVPMYLFKPAENNILT